MGVKSRTFDVPATGVNGSREGKNYRVKLTPEERKRVEAMIKNATSLTDIIRLEKELNEGKVPGGALGAGGGVDGMDET